MIAKTKKARNPSDRRRSIGGVLFPRIRGKLLRRFFANPDRRFYAGEISRLIEESLPAVRKELSILDEIGILKSEREGHHRYYWTNTGSTVYLQLKGLINRTVGAADVVGSALGQHAEKIIVAFIYGSVATDTDTARSDIDLAVIGSLTFRELSVALGQAEAPLGREINPTLYTKEEFADKLKSGNHFVNALLKGHKLFLIGSDNDLRDLARQSMD